MAEQMSGSSRPRLGSFQEFWDGMGDVSRKEAVDAYSEALGSRGGARSQYPEGLTVMIVSNQGLAERKAQPASEEAMQVSIPVNLDRLVGVLRGVFQRPVN